MKKLIFVLLCFSILTLGSSAKIIGVVPAGAWGIGLIGAGGGAVEEGTVLEFEELFDFGTVGTPVAVESDPGGMWDVTGQDPTNLLLANGTHALLGTPGENDYFHAVFATASGGVDQAVKMKMGEASINTGYYVGYGALLRAQNADATGTYYRMYVKGDSVNCVFSVEYYTNFTNTDYVNKVTISQVTDGDWIGFAVTGTGASTVFSFWDFGTSDPGDYGSWGAATQTLDNTGLDTPLDTGSYMGFFLSYHGSVPRNTIDTWEGGGW